MIEELHEDAKVTEKLYASIVAFADTILVQWCIKKKYKNSNHMFTGEIQSEEKLNMKQKRIL